MKKFAVIGCGSFGSNVAKTLFDEGHEVLVIDFNKSLIQKAKDFCSDAILADATDKETMEEIGIKDFDTVIISLGQRMETSILTTLHLKEIGIKNIIVKAVNEDHMKILSKLGTNKIIFPERDMALRLAKQLSTPNLLDYLPVVEDVSTYEIVATKSFLGKTIKELDLRNRYSVLIIAIKKKDSEIFHYIPPSDFKIEKEDLMVVMGKNKDLEKVKELD